MIPLKWKLCIEFYLAHISWAKILQKSCQKTTKSAELLRLFKDGFHSIHTIIENYKNFHHKNFYYSPKEKKKKSSSFHFLAFVVFPFHFLFFSQLDIIPTITQMYSQRKEPKRFKILTKQKILLSFQKWKSKSCQNNQYRSDVIIQRL